MDIQPAPIGEQVLFRVDRDEEGVIELFALPGSLRSTSPRRR
jgi:hypothetical protein